MKPEHWLTLANVILTAIGLYFAPKIAVKRALEQFRATKWWEKQQEAYSCLLGHISTIRYDARLECAAIEEDCERTRGEFLAQLTKTAYFEVERFSAQGDYLISPAAAKALQKFQKVIDGWSVPENMSDAHKLYGNRLEAATECIAVLTAEAKKTLLQ